jgi:uncharacterized membrane protein YedE/YeeE
MNKEWIVALVTGLLFGTGLLISGMTQPEKIISFLDFTSGQWDPTLAFVMIGGIGIHAPLRLLVLKRPTPLFAMRFDIPTLKEIDKKLIGGSAMFGAGWGLAGFCPGPSLVAAASGSVQALIFVGAMLAGMWIQQRPR